MFTSLGYHTFAISMSLTQEEADILFGDFKRYRDNTGEICIMGPAKFDKDPSGRHYKIVYPNQNKGITWRIRFSSKGFFKNGEYITCTIKAIINPKILTGEKTYIVAADERYLEDVQRIFNREAKKISPMLRRFENYSLNRIDYCINFDVSELKFDYPHELKNRLPEMIMTLIKQGNISRHFTEEYNDEKFQFYLRSDSMVINCYWKHDDLRRNFPDCKDLGDSFNIIRFEVQYKYPKIQSDLAKMKKEQGYRSSVLLGVLKKQGFYDYFSENQDNMDCLRSAQLMKKFEAACRKESRVMKGMLSDEKCGGAINKYYYKVIKKGNYYTFDAARRIIEEKVSRWEKIVRLTETLKMISNHEGIAKAKSTLQDEKLEEFQRSLRELSHLRINPVTIPKEWGIDYIPNLLDNYYAMLAEEQDKKWEEKMNRQILEDYIKRCKKEGRKRKKNKS